MSLRYTNPEHHDWQSNRHTKRRIEETAVFQVRMGPLVKAAREQAAADETRSLALSMAKLLNGHLNSKGYRQ
jgi:hypothetical protein